MATSQSARSSACWSWWPLLVYLAESFCVKKLQTTKREIDKAFIKPAMI